MTNGIVEQEHRCSLNEKVHHTVKFPRIAINEIANVCEETGADVSRSPAASAWTTASARSSCRPDRLRRLVLPEGRHRAQAARGQHGYHFQLLNSVIEVNELQKRRVIGKLKKHLGSLVGRRIGLLGLAFKPNTDDMREATSLVLARGCRPPARRSAPTTRSPRTRRAS